MKIAKDTMQPPRVWRSIEPITDYLIDLIVYTYVVKSYKTLRKLCL
jgi:hypothetical protein